MSEGYKKLPGSGAERERLRAKGQFWTPDWVAEAMVAYVVAGESDHIFDPSVGAGAFFRAARIIERSAGRRLTLFGTEVDPEALAEARQSGIPESDLLKVQIADFALRPPEQSFKAIVANPPYIRHHRLSEPAKTELRSFGAKLLGEPLDGRAGLHIYFLLRALELLADNGRLAFIMPADTCEGVFSSALWGWVTKKFCLDAVITFSAEASPFPGVDTNPIIFFIKNSRPETFFTWAKCRKANTDQLREWALSNLKSRPSHTLSVCRRQLSEGLATGLSRPPLRAAPAGPTLARFAKVQRGIATGANEYFFLTANQARALRIPSDYLRLAIGRTRDVKSDQVSDDMMCALDDAGRPTLLFAPDGRPLSEFPRAVREYLKGGEASGINQRTLIATRRPWYKMEKRAAPPILFAYLGRRSARFIRNRAEVLPLTGFLCVYPHDPDPAAVDRLWQVLSHPETIANLSLVGKSYGSGALKVEPRQLEKLPLPASVVSRSGL